MPAAVRDVRRMYCTRQGGAHRDAESAQRASSVDKGKNNKIKKNTTAICRRSQLRRLACAPPRAAGAWRRNRSTCASTAGPSLLSEGTPLAPSLASFTSGRFLSHEQIFLNLPPVSLSLALSLLVFFPFSSGRCSTCRGDGDLVKTLPCVDFAQVSRHGRAAGPQRWGSPSPTGSSSCCSLTLPFSCSS